jgi:hypothetical protein
MLAVLPSFPIPLVENYELRHCRRQSNKGQIKFGSVVAKADTWPELAVTVLILFPSATFQKILNLVEAPLH